ncbi:PKD domain-containing protein [Mariniphaga sediminis]|uniref:PKD domain-containing protein n=1 Tax=Mariniphaga sediminis TaxID=1628158 RepID=UPI00356A59E1
MAEKLTEITTQYHTFVDNQVLTKDQLNGFINYFEDQHRLSRVFLNGVGVVCGFKLKYNNSAKTVTISQGVGVTTDGDLILLRKNVPLSTDKSIDLKEIKFTHFRKFEDNFANYAFFRRTEDGGETETLMDLWEILPGQTEEEDPLGELPDLENKVVLLYLEGYAKEGDLCTTVDCDNQGVEQVARLRVLLVSKEDATYIAENDSLFSKYDMADKYFDLPDVAVPRVILNPNNSSDYESLKLAFHKAINNKTLLSNLSSGITKIAEDFNSILQIKLPKNTLPATLGKLKEIAGFGSFSLPFNVQYRYDCFKDVVDTYMEIKALLLSLKEECCPDIHAFPKHLLLGSLDEIDSPVKHFRHRFYKSPALACGGGKIEQCRKLFLRLVEIIKEFGEKEGKIKITPSRRMVALGDRAIPFYYDVNLKLLEYWNYFKTEKNAQNTNLSYHRENLANWPHIQNPLNYNIDGFDFYRIEGHQGKDYRTALEEINGQKEQYGLAFDVKALSVNLNVEDLNIEDYDCEFEDLQVMLRAWTAEQECILGEVSKFFSGFSLVNPGTNVKDPVLTHRVAAKAFTTRDTSFTSRLTTNFEGVTGDKVFAARESVSKDIAGGQTLAFNSTIIPDNLTTEKDALGSVLVTAFEETKGGSVNDVIAKSKALVEEQISDEVWAEQPEMKAFVIDQSIELLAWSNELVVKMPGKLQDFTVNTVDRYKLTLKELCSRVKLLKNRYQNIELTQSLKLFMDLLINQLSFVCCSGKKLEILFEEINKRKESILLRLQLAKFIEKHPGAEHKAGVQPGGTFVLVYLNKTRATKARREAIISRAAAAEFLKISEVPNNTVVADFSLPYLCCSDCAPVNFIVPRRPATLRLEKETWCIGSDTGSILYEVSPEDGTVVADPETAGLTIENGKITIDPAVFPEEMLGKPIGFTVNQQVTDAELTVFKTPQVDFEAPERVPLNQEITFSPFGDIEGASFLWDFGDGSPTSAKQNPTHAYDELPGTEKNIVVVKLTVTGSNGSCSGTAEHEIELFEEVIEVDLDGRDFCESDKTGHPFTISPQGADVLIEGAGVEPTSAGGFVFVPANAGVGGHEFTVNGEPSGIIATVHARPVAAFEPRQEGNQLILTNNSTGAISFVWSVNEEKFERSDTSPVVIELTPNSPTTWSLVLTANSEFCGTVTTDVITFETKVEPPVDTCLDRAKSGMEADLKILRELNLPGSNFVVPIWMSTSELYGGTEEFSNGVLNDVDNFLNGNNNEKLPSLFLELLIQTSQMVAELSGTPENEEFQNLVRIFALQLRLFYNVIGCQNNDVLDASKDILGRMFEQIISILRNLKEREVKLPDSLREFMNAWAERVAGKGILEEHVKIILEENLV